MQSPNLKTSLPTDFWQRLKNGDTVPFQGIGESMRPFFPSGTWFLLKRDPLNQITVGNIVLMETNGATVLHRVIKIQNGSSKTIFTRGDSYAENDLPWQQEDYRARVVGVMKESSPQTIDLSILHKALEFSYRFSGPILRQIIPLVRKLRAR